MSECFNCGKEFTLKEKDIKCDSCGEKVNFRCHNCKSWFPVYDEETKQKLKECKVCGFFYCPNCGVCGINCEKGEWCQIIKEIFAPEINYSNVPNLSDKIQKLLTFIEELKLGKEQKSCHRQVPISYAKSRIKRCFVKMLGYRVNDYEDMKEFKSRLNKVLSSNVGEFLSVNKSREKGSYGQEFRDAFNYAICIGKLEKVEVEKLIDNEIIKLPFYKRVEKGDCPYLDDKDLIVKVCSNKDCKIKKFPLSQTECCDPRCNYKKGVNKGKPRKLKLKISTKDICQLNRGEFKKEEEDGGI